MAGRLPEAELLAPAGTVTGLAAEAHLLTWADVERRLRSNGSRWLTTVRPDGTPHVVPVFGAWSQGVVFLASKESARKSRNLDADPRCVLATEADGAQLVIEGRATRVHDGQTLTRASEAFDTVYGWATAVSGDELDAEYGAPTSGGPPYRVYQIAPRTVFAFPTTGAFVPTRWRYA